MKEEYLLVIFASSSSCLNSSLAFCNLLLFSLYSSFILLFTNWSNTWTHTGNTDVIVTSLSFLTFLCNLSFAKPVSSDLRSAAGIEGQRPSYEAPSPRWRTQTPEESHRSMFKCNGSICIYPDRVINLIYMEVHYTYWLRSIMLSIQFFSSSNQHEVKKKQF